MPPYIVVPKTEHTRAAGLPAWRGYDYRCNECRTIVPDEVHREHGKVYDAMYEGGLGDGNGGLEDCFVHVQGPEDEFDEDSFVVTCDRHFIAELAENLILPH